MDIDDTLGLVSNLEPVSKYFLYQFETKESSGLVFAHSSF